MVVLELGWDFERERWVGSEHFGREKEKCEWSGFGKCWNEGMGRNRGENVSFNSDVTEEDRWNGPTEQSGFWETVSKGCLGPIDVLGRTLEVCCCLRGVIKRYLIALQDFGRSKKKFWKFFSNHEIVRLHKVKGEWLVENAKCIQWKWEEQVIYELDSYFRRFFGFFLVSSKPYLNNQSKSEIYSTSPQFCQSLEQKTQFRLLGTISRDQCPFREMRGNMVSCILLYPHFAVKMSFYIVIDMIWWFRVKKAASPVTLGFSRS